MVFGEDFSPSQTCGTVLNLPTILFVTKDSLADLVIHASIGQTLTAIDAILESASP